MVSNPKNVLPKSEKKQHQKLGIIEPWPANVNLNFQNDADDGGDGGGAVTTHPSWQVSREHHAQGPNMPFRYHSL